ncbi:MAG: glycosyltransferase family 4 protein [Candidatus Helarchaeota archaeon]
MLDIKRILIITPEFPPPIIGGGGSHVKNLVDKLKNYPYKIYIFAQDIYLKKFFFPKIQKLSENVLLYRFPVFKIRKILYYLISPAFIIEFLKIKPHIIHGHGYPCNAVDLGIILANLFKIPFILTLHGFPLTQSFFQKVYHTIYHNLIGNFIFKKSSKLIFVSKSLLFDYRFLINQNNIKKIIIIPNGINIKELTKNSNAENIINKLNLKNHRILFSIGRLDKTKGFQNVIKIFKNLSENFNVVYLIAGPDSGYRSELQNLIKKNNLENKIFLLGLVDEQRKRDLYAAAEIVLCPSLYEPFGIVILEAMAFGKPIISSNIGGIKEIIKDNYDGILVNPGDRDLLLKKIILLLKDDELRKKLGTNAKNSVKRFDWNAIIKKIDKVYNQF